MSRRGRSGTVPAEGVLRIAGVTKQYRDVTALDGVSFDVRKGEIFGYIGPNGAGKTTTIKIMVGLLRDFQGTVTMDGHAIPSDAAAVQKLLGYLPQKAAFQEWRTVDQALSTFGRLSGMSPADLDKRIPEVLEILGVSDTRRRKITQLSGGTVQKIGMAQSILHDPALLVLDEPMTGLDPEARYQFKELFKRLRAQGTTVFFSSHILSDVQDIADRIGILDHGRVLHVGTFDELRARMKIARDVEIVLSRDSDRGLEPSALAWVAGVDRVGPDRMVAHVKSDVDMDEAIDALIDGLKRGGYRIRSIRPVVPDLEELYVRFVEGRSG